MPGNLGAGVKSGGASEKQTIIGTDEAGYGPNLGPLVIAGTAWDSDDPSQMMPDFVVREKSDFSSLNKKEKTCHLLVADSKQVYQSGKIQLLERGVLAFVFSLTGELPRNLGQLARLLGVSDEAFTMPGYGGDLELRELQIPIAADCDVVAELGSRLRDRPDGPKLTAIGCRAIFAEQFNLQCESFGNKANLLSAQTMRLVNELSEGAGRNLEVFCDKHGGRSRYAGLLQQELSFCDRLVQIVEEGRAVSRYRVGSESVEVTFCARGESHLPIALASMTAKYLRELFMNGWNRYWISLVPDLRPTRGYPVDAKRFWCEIEEAVKSLGMKRSSIWRHR